MGSTDTIVNNVPFDLLLTIKDKQAMNGMGYGDYQRYRQYCATKLRKLRQSLGVTHGKGGLRKKPLPVKKLTPAQQQRQQKQRQQQQQQQSATSPPVIKGRKAIERHRKDQERNKKDPSKEEQDAAFQHKKIATVEDFMKEVESDQKNSDQQTTNSMEMTEDVARKLMLIPLLQSERAWTYAMDLKQEHADDGEGAHRKKFHYMKRLKKAAMWADQLKQLCDELGDQKTRLEAEAYNHWIHGTLLLELEQWRDALERFLHARTIYDNMSQVGRVALKEVFRQRVEEIDLSVRMCKYNLDRTSANSRDIVAEIESQASPALDVLKSKLDQALEETRRAQARTMEEIEWGGRSIAVENEKIRMAIVNADSLRDNIADCKSIDAKLRIYDKILLSLSDSQRYIREDMKANENRSDEQIANIRFIYSYASFLSLQRTLERNLLMAEQLEERLESKHHKDDKTTSAGRRQRRVKKGSTSPLDVVHLYDVVLQNLNDLQELPGVEGDEQLFKRLNCQVACYRVFRCFYLGEVHAQTGEWKKAYALYKRAEQLAEIARMSLRDQSENDREHLPNIDALLERIHIAQFHTNSQYIIQQRQEEENEGQQFATPRTTSTIGDGKRAVLSHLDEFEVDTRGRVLLASFPPNFEAIPAKPVFFDIANNSIQYPDIKPKMGQEEEEKEQESSKKRGWFGLW